MRFNCPPPHLHWNHWVWNQRQRQYYVQAVQAKKSGAWAGRTFWSAVERRLLNLRRNLDSILSRLNQTGCDGGLTVLVEASKHFFLWELALTVTSKFTRSHKVKQCHGGHFLTDEIAVCNLAVSLIQCYQMGRNSILGIKFRGLKRRESLETEF